MNVAILALQGAFAEHQQMLQSMEVSSTLIRNLDDWHNYVSANERKALIIPGGESTAMTRIIHDEALYNPVREAIIAGMPVFGTCAGLIMLDDNHLNTMDIRVRRNAYGRQLGSFNVTSSVNFPSADGVVSTTDFPMVFIRAPFIESVGPDVKVLAEVDGHIVAALQGSQLVTAFHPELTSDTRLHSLFLSLVNN